jgi:hypothetical protein
MRFTESTASAEAATTHEARAGQLSIRIFGALLCLAVAAIHVIDQHGFPGSKEPSYVGIGFYVVEAAGVLAALLLLSRRVRVGWFLSLGVAAGPLLGYVLSRGPGLPEYTDDIGKWTEPLGVVSLVVEAVLLVLALAMVRNVLRPVRPAARVR